MYRQFNSVASFATYIHEEAVEAGCASVEDMYPLDRLYDRSGEHGLLGAFLIADNGYRVKLRSEGVEVRRLGPAKKPTSFIQRLAQYLVERLYASMPAAVLRLIPNLPEKQLARLIQHEWDSAYDCALGSTAHELCADVIVSLLQQEADEPITNGSSIVANSAVAQPLVFFNFINRLLMLTMTCVRQAQLDPTAHVAAHRLELAKRVMQQVCHALVIKHSRWRRMLPIIAKISNLRAISRHFKKHTV